MEVAAYEPANTAKAGLDTAPPTSTQLGRQKQKPGQNIPRDTATSKTATDTSLDPTNADPGRHGLDITPATGITGVAGDGAGWQQEH